MKAARQSLTAENTTDFPKKPSLPTADETCNITVRNVRGGGIYAVSLAGEIKNFSMYGIEAFNGAKMLLDQRGKQ